MSMSKGLIGKLVIRCVQIRETVILRLIFLRKEEVCSNWVILYAYRILLVNY